MLDKGITKLRLVIDVDYFNNGEAEETLEHLLKAIAAKAANDGLMTGETPAEVETWTAKVSKRM